MLDLGLATHIDYVGDVGSSFGYIGCGCSWTNRLSISYIHRYVMYVFLHLCAPRASMQ